MGGDSALIGGCGDFSVCFSPHPNTPITMTRIPYLKIDVKYYYNVNIEFDVCKYLEITSLY